MKTLRVASLVFKANLWVAGLSAVVALVAWSLPLLAHRPATSIADVRVGLAGGYALGTTLAVSILLGFGLVSTGLQEGSMAFHMARPLSAWQVWLGRLSAAWALAAGCGLLVWLALTFTRESWVENARVLGGLGILAFGILLLFHAVGTSLRAHSAWMILDLASLGLAALGGLGLAEMMVGRWESQEVTAMATLIVGGGFLVLLLAGWRSIHAGRTSLAGSHRALSITLFMGMLVVHGSSWVYRWRLRTVTATDIPSIAFMGGGQEGPWLHVGDWDRSWNSSMRSVLLNTDTGHGFRVPSEALALSGNGRVAVWWEFKFPPFGSGLSLQKARLGRDGATVEDTGLRPPLREGSSLRQAALALSEDGSQVACLVGHEISIHSLADGSELLRESLDGASSAPLLEGGGMVFLGPDHLRAFISEGGAARSLGLYEVDLQRRSIARTGKVEHASFWQIRAIDAGARHMLLRRSEASRNTMELRDASTGTLLRVVGEWQREPGIQAQFLPDDGLAVLEYAPGKVSLRRLDVSGKVVWESTLPMAPGGMESAPPVIAMDSQAAPGQMKCTIRYRSRTGERTATTYRVALQDGHLDRDPDPVAPRYVWDESRWRTAASEGAFPRRFRLTERGTLLRVTPGGSTQWVAGPR